MTLGYLVLGRRAVRLDLAERVAAMFSGGASEREALACLSLPKREWPAVGGALRDALGDAF